MVDANSQGDVTTALWWPDVDNLSIVLDTQIKKISQDKTFVYIDVILHHEKEVDIIPTNIELSSILNMKNNGQVLNMNLDSGGIINISLVIQREVFKRSILANAFATIGLYNHPIGNIKPFKEDFIVTRKLQKCG